MQKFVSEFLNDDAGATAIEYAFIASGIGLAVIIAVQAIGLSLNLSFSDMATKF